MSEDVVTQDEGGTASLAAPAIGPGRPDASAELQGAESPARGQYWLRVHGYPADLDTEIVYYCDFFDLREGRLPSDPQANLKMGDVLVYYADGPGSIYGVASITGEVGSPAPDVRRSKKWMVPIKREAIIRSINKAPHAVPLVLPSGYQFLPLVRDYTYIRLPREDGEYLVEQVRSRASTRE
ncbi:MAG: hypothetical protein HW416_1549 [Chloroflexi bacterium]|nr:hypothetical protein [Chloroflexota bacterium]